MDKLIYLIDIDNTICEEEGEVVNRKPFMNRIKRINELHSQGHYIVYSTARGVKSGRGEKYYRSITEKQLNGWVCKYHELTFKQHNPDVYVDDKSVSIKDFFI